MKIYFTKHAEEKFEVLAKHSFEVSKRQVIDTLELPDIIDQSRSSLLIAQKKIDQKKVLRVVYKIEFGIIKVITFYPWRSKQYEKETRNN